MIFLNKSKLKLPSSEYIKHHLTNLTYGKFPDGHWGLAHTAEEDKEMEELKENMKSAGKKPTYRGELFYDFKKFKAKPKFFGLQCCCIF